MSVLDQTVRIVEAFIANVGMPVQGMSSALSQLIVDVHNTLATLEAAEGKTRPAMTPAVLREEMTRKSISEVLVVQEASVERQLVDQPRIPAVPTSQAVSKDTVTCLVCGKVAKTLKGHLTRTHHMDVNAYRAMFSLAKDFPIVAPSYSERRRQLAVDSGLGDKLREGRRRKLAVA